MIIFNPFVTKMQFSRFFTNNYQLIMKHIKPIILSLLLLISIVASFKVYKSEQLKQQLKADIIELSDVEYGLLNVDNWERLLAKIIASKLQDINDTPMDKDAMKKNVASLLKTLIDDYEKTLLKKNAGGLFGSVKNSLYSSAFDGIREDIPMLTDKVMVFLDVENNNEGLTEFIVVLLKDYTQGTFDRTDYTQVDKIIKTHEGDTSENTAIIIQQKIENQQKNTALYKVLLSISFIAFILLFFFSNTITKIEYLVGILFSFILLLLGITLPMIEIDARISEISFSFLNESINFKDQVLFYKSKSIYEVVTLMMTQHKVDLLIVGGLIFLFSVLFPITKLTSSILYLINKKMKNSKIIQFFIFKTGKWSMADVFVIAIMMTFIGFEGIISDQLNQLTTISESVDILTTNNSSILFGFYSFTAFVLISLSVSLRLHKLNKVQ